MCYIFYGENTEAFGSIQTGRANVKSTASLLYKIFDATRPVRMLRLTNMCSIPARCVLRRQINAVASGLNRPFISLAVNPCGVQYFDNSVFRKG